jgi:uncharacterized protein YbaP (TraB family)
MRTRLHLIFFFCLLPIFGSFAQDKPEFTGALLWKISGNGLDKPTYIFGTHHLIRMNLSEDYPQVLKALNESERFIGEVALGDLQNIQSPEALNLMSMPKDTAYENIFTETELLTLETELTYMTGFGLQEFGNVKPAVISAFYLVAASLKNNPPEEQDIPEPIDLFLMKTAQNMGKSILGLESVYEQFDILFNSQPLKRQADQLYCTVTHSEYLPEYTKLTEQYYAQADLIKLNDMFNDNTQSPCENTSEEKNALNKDRNDKWIKKLPGLMQEKSNFIAVGCLHLAGEDGLLSKLHKLGYNIEAVK